MWWSDERIIITAARTTYKQVPTFQATNMRVTQCPATTANGKSPAANPAQAANTNLGLARIIRKTEMRRCVMVCFLLESGEEPF
jgi:hypothetical protein